MIEQSTTIAEVQSGKIELVFNGICSTLQFNCTCMDALPWCRAMCCRLRSAYSVVLRKDEADRFASRPHPHSPHLRILQDAQGSCFYLKDNKCAVHESGKPIMCTLYHCSPGGVGEGIEYRDGGWILAPMKLHENIDDDGTIVSLTGNEHTTT